MSWVEWVVVAVLAVGLGFAGGRVALARGRRATAEVAPAPEAAFAIEHLDGSTWSLTNTGASAAQFVTIMPLADGVEQWPPQPVPGSVTTATSERLPTLEPGGSVSIWLSRHDRGQQVLVGWTSAERVRMGPVLLDVPAP